MRFGDTLDDSYMIFNKNSVLIIICMCLIAVFSMFFFIIKMNKWSKKVIKFAVTERNKT